MAHVVQPGLFLVENRKVIKNGNYKSKIDN